MALKRRRDAKMWQDIFNFYVIVIISGPMLFVTCEPVGYTRISLDELTTIIKMVNHNSSEEVCRRFASKEEVNMGDLLNLPCESSPADFPVTDEKDNEAITCSTTTLPTVSEGSFDCANNSDVEKGETCNLTCNEGFYPASLNRTVCEAGTSDEGVEWSKGNFECRAITCQVVDLPTVNDGYFNCSGYSVGDKCNLTCDDDYYPSSSKETVCEENINSTANWTVGNFQCTAITCSTTNLPTFSEGSFDCVPDTIVSKGGSCNLTCNEGFYPAPSDQTVCEAGRHDGGGAWSEGSLECRAITCSTTNLPTVGDGSFDCAPDTIVSKGGACNLTCNEGFYSVHPNQTICEAKRHDVGGEWSMESFECRGCNVWNRWKGKEYKLITTKQTWEESRLLCEDASSHLITIENKEENEFVLKKVWNCFRADSPSDRTVWIGLNDVYEDGTWEWIEGSGARYRNWAGGEPIDASKFDYVFFKSDGEWQNTGDSDYYAVCERLY